MYLHILAYHNGEEPVIIAAVSPRKDRDLNLFARVDYEEFTGGLLDEEDKEEFIADQIKFYEDGQATTLLIDLDDLPGPIP